MRHLTPTWQRYLRAALTPVWLAVGLALTGCVLAGISAGPPAEEARQPAAPGALDGIPVGLTAEGYPYRGEPEAPVTIHEFSDYLCPYCGRHNNETMPELLEEYVRGGQVRYVFRDFPIESLHPTADLGHLAAKCVGEQGAELYWRMHDQLFARQAEWAQLPDPADFLSEVAADVGADRQLYQRCQADDRYQEWLSESIAAGSALGFNATPSFQLYGPGEEGPHTLIGALPAETFSGWFDALAAGEGPPVEPTPERPALPPWATAEGLAPDPARTGYTQAGDLYKGDPAAKLVIVEFSDYACPACARHALQSQPIIDRELIEAGQVMWLAKDLPLAEHRASAPLAAVAAECAGEQGSYWEMRSLLFARQADWTQAEAESLFDLMATELQLDEVAFQACRDGRGALGRVLSDLYDAQELGLTRTPSFLLIYAGEATFFDGVLDGRQFVQVVEGFLRDQASGTAEQS
ncbi:MAG: DsbA family protein [Candidatus Promineifilaceae bacterium]